MPDAEVVLTCSAAGELQSSSRMSNIGSIASIFKRGGQKPEFPRAADDPDAEDASQQLDQHLQQLSVAWAAPRQRYVLAACDARNPQAAHATADPSFDVICCVNIYIMQQVLEQMCWHCCYPAA